jgi:hypothetical protein
MKISIREFLESIGVAISDHSRQPGVKPIPAASHDLFKTEVERQKSKQIRRRIDDSFLR